MSRIECISLATMQPSPLPQASVICLGNFDGVHLAHQALMHEAVRIKQEKLPDAAACALCFRVPSSDLLKGTPPAHLCTMEQKLEYFRDAGMEYAILVDFSAIRAFSPEAFVSEILKAICGCVAAVCGFNYHFGYKGAGDAEKLKALLDGKAWVQDEITVDGLTVSSTNIRAMIADGRVKAAAALLGRPYAMRSTIVRGKGLGHKMGIPTINQYFQDGILPPKSGVYITDCTVNGHTYRGVSNVGVHPTVDLGAALNCETHLLDCNEDLYGKSATVHFLERLREEEKFDSLAALTSQIAADIRAAKDYRTL